MPGSNPQSLTRREVYERADQLRVLRYELDIDLTKSSTSAQVTTRIEFEWHSPGSPTFADLDARPTSAALNGRLLPSEAHAGGRLRLDELEPMNSLVVEAEVGFANDGKGICEYADPKDGTRYVYTKGMPFVAPRILCCFQGANQAPFDISVAAPRGWSCVSHSAVVENPPEGESGRWRFATTSPMPPEQLVVASGPLARSSLGQENRSTEITLYGRQSVTDELRRTEIALWLAELVDIEARLLGVDYPFDRLNILFMPNWSALGGSSPGITALHEILLHESLDADHRRHVIWALAHELAHAWFGNLVMDRRWEATWLTEGLATYTCYRAMEILAPELHPWALFHVLEEAEAHDADSSADTHPVAATAKADASFAPQRGETYVFRAPIVYAKPAALVRQLATVIGDDAVLDGLRKYLTKHAFDEATTEDLITSWSESAGRDLTQWASEWLRSPGINTLEARIVSEGGILREVKVLQSGDPLRTHNLIVTVYDVLEGKLVAREPIAITVDGESTAIVEIVGARTPQIVLLNAPPTTYAKVRFDDQTREMVRRHMHELGPADRATCWVAGFEMVSDELMAKEEFGHWVERYGELERDRAVQDLLASKLS